MVPLQVSMAGRSTAIQRSGSPVVLFTGVTRVIQEALATGRAQGSWFAVGERLEQVLA